jgi:hypothetical protein
MREEFERLDYPLEVKVVVLRMLARVLQFDPLDLSPVEHSQVSIIHDGETMGLLLRIA